MSIIASFGIASLAGCMEDLDTQRRRIDELDLRTGPISTLAETEAATVASTPGNAENETSTRTIEAIVGLMDAGTPRKITLSEVTQSTIRSNLGLQSSLLAPEIAAAQLRGEQAKFEATFEASVNQGRTISPTFFPGETIGVKSDSTSFVPALNVPLRSGGTVNLDWTVATEDNITGIQPDEGNVVSQPGITLDQPLLRGAGFAYNEASIVIAESNFGAERSDARLAVINEVVRAEVAYWNTYQAWRILQVNLSLYQTAKDLLNSQRKLVAKGTSSIANVYNFEVSLADAVDGVIQSELGFRLAVRNLKTVMQDPDLSLDGTVALLPDTKPRLNTFEFDPKKLVDFALANRADLLSLEFEMISQTVEVLMRKNEMLPELDIAGSWNLNGFDSNGLSIDKANRDLFDNDQQGGWSFGMTASVPLGNEAAIAAYQSALLTRLRSIANVHQQQITVAGEVLDAIDTLQTTWDSILAARYRVEAARRFYAAYKTLFQRGQIPSSNLTQALESVNNAEINQVRTEVTYQISLARLAQAAGCLLGHAGVEWESILDQEGIEDSASPPTRGIADQWFRPREVDQTPIAPLFPKTSGTQDQSPNVEATDADSRHE
ncbi:MAG: hypothetical protein CL849_01655 [Crocinitomicaceae bacterium]|nr:hypothetical protein [Crocinitomicaceae bacterium]